jgi:hypothetical protein
LSVEGRGFGPGTERPRDVETTSSYCVNSIESRAMMPRSTELCASTNQYIRFLSFLLPEF